MLKLLLAILVLALAAFSLYSDLWSSPPSPAPTVADAPSGSQASPPPSPAPPIADAVTFKPEQVVLPDEEFPLSGYRVDTDERFGTDGWVRDWDGASTFSWVRVEVYVLAPSATARDAIARTKCDWSFHPPATSRAEITAPVVGDGAKACAYDLEDASAGVITYTTGTRNVLVRVGVGRRTASQASTAQWAASLADYQLWIVDRVAPPSRVALRPAPKVQVPAAAVTVAPRPPTKPVTGPVTVGGITFQISSQGAADIYAEATISSSDRATITATADADIVHMQTAFGRPYTRRPRIYVFATTASVTQGLQSIFGKPGPEAQTLAATRSGSFERSSTLVAIEVNWSKIKESKPITTIRHELTHMMQRQIVPTMDIPRWFTEGTAELEEFTVPGSDYRANEARYGAASMAATGGLFSIGEATSLTQWRALPEGNYQQAAQMAQLIRDDIGGAGLLRIYDLMAQGETFDRAYLAASGRSLATFSASFAARIKALAPAYPGIATATDSPAGPGLAYLLYGFTPGSSVTVSISGAGSTNSTKTVNAYGVYSTHLDSSWPAGAYRITATGPNGTATVAAVK